MNSLFLIGNGFDLAHGMKTSYEHFHQHLKNKYKNSNANCFTPPEAILMEGGHVFYNQDDVVCFLINIISQAESKGDKWSDLEFTLGNLHLDEFLNDFIDDDYKDNGWKSQVLSSNLAGAVMKIKDYFSEWINSIEIDNISPKSDFENMINKESDFFLTFNYTKTMEMLYKVKNICHIHGKQGEELLFGHGNEKNYYSNYTARYVGSENLLQELQSSLRKKTLEAINKNKFFFHRLSNLVSRVYSYGFSFSEIDQIYIKEICSRVLTESITWYLSDYEDANQRNHIMKVINLCGFKGEFDTFHIS
ncbi:UNVERIFIED_CONTAM: abortive infection AbiH-like protein [Acetivibrio alkalicellulosi]